MLELEIPNPFDPAQHFGLHARILRLENIRSREPQRPHAMALRWMLHGEEEQKALENLMRACSSGPLTQSRWTASSARTSAPGPEEAERRGLPRTTFDREIVTLDPEQRVEHALVGLDLSRSGMRVRPHPDLALHQRVHVALYAGEESGTLLLKAEVTRDDGPRGLALQFVEVSPDSDACLQAFIDQLPAIQALHPQTERVVMGQLISNT